MCVRVCAYYPSEILRVCGYCHCTHRACVLTHVPLYYVDFHKSIASSALQAE
eukprot:m.582564 g.582564  ORF g.582564 m.582564 type:complete len:52 (+) comp22337_c1_seq16:1453-1608(+)